MATALEAALARLVPAWASVAADQKARLVELVRQIAADGRLDDLLDLRVDTAAAAETLLRAMVDLGSVAAGQMVAEADAQDVTIGKVQPPRQKLADVASVVAALLGAELVVSASRAAMRANHAGATADDIAAAVREQLDSLSSANAETQLGGALHGAMNAGRVATLLQAPEAAIYSSEVMDKRTCTPCRRVNGKWLGNISDMPQIERLYPSNGYGGFVDCEGGVRCRGTIVVVWRPEQATPPPPAANLLPILSRTYKRDKSGRFASSIHSTKQIHAAFDFHDPKTGMTAKVSGIRAGAGGHKYVDIAITNAEGVRCGGGIRTLSANGETVYHSGLAMNPNFGAVQGQGFATRLNAQAEIVYRANGVKTIELTAGSTVGGYAWARAGFNFKDGGSRLDIARRAAGMKRQYAPDVQRQIDRVSADSAATPIEFAMIGHTPGATMWPGKEIMLGSMWQGVKHLD